MKALLGIGAIVTTLALVSVLLWRRKGGPDIIEPFGPFELITHTLEYRTGWNTGRLATGSIDAYSLRYRGRPFRFAGKAGMFGDDTATYERMHRVIVVSREPPVFAVDVGDPNNSSFFYLVREVNGAVSPEFIALARAGPSAGFVDASTTDTATTEEQARRRTRGAAPRFLLLAQNTVLDVDDLKTYPLRELEDFSPNHFLSAHAFSPDQRSFARFGFTHPPESRPGFEVHDFIDSTSYFVPIDRVRMRYNEWAEIDSAWAYHHFEWKRGPDGRDRFVERTGFVPLPHRGYRSIQGNDSTYREYTLKHVSQEMVDALSTFLERELGAKRTEREEVNGHLHASFTFGDRIVHLLGRDDEVGLWMDRGADTALVWEVGDRFDQVLATGRYDALFLP